MLDELGLIHMNGRIYDPLLGRFLSADPHIQAPGNLQNYNRYSYVLNNPLSITDPSGFFFKKKFKKIGNFLKKYRIDNLYETIQSDSLAGKLGLVSNSGLAYSISTGDWNINWKQVAIMAATTLLTMGIGAAVSAGLTAISNAATAATISAATAKTLTVVVHLTKAVAHGVVQGGAAELQGGDFKDGFLAGATGSLAGSAMMEFGGPLGQAGSGWDGGKIVVRTVTAAAIGGTVSEIGGGKFSNGAVTAAMVHLFNAEAHGAVEKIDHDKHGFSDEIFQKDESGNIIEWDPVPLLDKGPLSNGDPFPWMAREVQLKGTNGKWYTAYKWVSGNPGGITNCHGTSCGAGQYWINNSEMADIVKDFFVPSAGINNGDLVVWGNSSDMYQHSSIITGANATLNSSLQTGLGGTQRTVSTSPIGGFNQVFGAPRAYNLK